MAKDPVCGMDVNPEQAAGKSEYKGQTYYFCAPGCKKQFDKDPERYVVGASRSVATTSSLQNQNNKSGNG